MWLNGSSESRWWCSPVCGCKVTSHGWGLSWWNDVCVSMVEKDVLQLVEQVTQSHQSGRIFRPNEHKVARCILTRLVPGGGRKIDKWAGGPRFVTIHILTHVQIYIYCLQSHILPVAVVGINIRIEFWRILTVVPSDSDYNDYLIWVSSSLTCPLVGRRNVLGVKNILHFWSLITFY